MQRLGLFLRQRCSKSGSSSNRGLGDAAGRELDLFLLRVNIEILFPWIPNKQKLPAPPGAGMAKAVMPLALTSEIVLYMRWRNVLMS